MNKIESRTELIKLIIVYVIDLGIMIALSAIFTRVGGTLPLIVKSLIIYALLLVPIIVFTVKKGQFTAEHFGFKRIKVSTIFLTVLLTLVSSPMYMFANVLSQLVVPNVIIQGMDNLIGDSVGLSFVAMAVLAPVCEEIICRGFFQNRLKNILPFAVSAVISGFMFGVLHLNLNQFCYAMVLGVVFAYANRASGSIFTSMIMHFLINATNIGIILLVKAALETVNMDLAEVAETSRTNQSSMLTSIVVVGVLAVISFFLTRLVLRAIAKRENTLEDVEELQPTADSIYN